MSIRLDNIKGHVVQLLCGCRDLQTTDRKLALEQEYRVYQVRTISMSLGQCMK